MSTNGMGNNTSDLAEIPWTDHHKRILLDVKRLKKACVSNTVYYSIVQMYNKWIGRWFSPGTLVSSTNKNDHHYITELLLKVALNTINLNLQ